MQKVQNGYEPKWQWHRLESKEEAEALFKDDESVQKWLDKTSDKRNNRISAVTHHEGQNAVHGSLVVCRNIEKPEEGRVFHYYVTEQTLITIGFAEAELLKSCKGSEEFFRRIRASGNPVEGFIQLISGVMEPFFDGMDSFEVKLHRMEIRMKDRNGGHLFHQALNLRYILLYWTGMTRPIREIRFALDEAFRELLAKSRHYISFTLRLERMVMLQEEYGQEVESLLLLDANISNYRGNEIMKTLTVFTVLCTPMTAFGAIWGMNFEAMPELKLPWGYAGALAAILLGTIGVYLWLRSKGWMGDLLRSDNKREEV